MPARGPAAAVAAVLALLAVPGVAAASCLPTAAEDSFETSHAAFAGTLVEQREATYVFDVAETLRGGPLPPRVEVVDEGHRTSVAMALTPGQEVGVVVRALRGAELVANGCLMTGPADLREIARRAELCRAGPRGASVVLGCARPGPGAFDRYRFLAARRAGGVCVTLVQLDRDRRIRCAGARLGDDAVRADGVLREPGGSRLYTGIARATATRVDVAYRLLGRRQRASGGLTAVTDGDALRALRVGRPFRRFVVRVPSGARRLVVTARRGGDVLGRHRVAP